MLGPHGTIIRKPLVEIRKPERGIEPRLAGQGVRCGELKTPAESLAGFGQQSFKVTAPSGSPDGDGSGGTLCRRIRSLRTATQGDHRSSGGVEMIVVRSIDIVEQHVHVLTKEEVAGDKDARRHFALNPRAEMLAVRCGKVRRKK